MVPVELLLADEAVLLVDEALTELALLALLALVEAELAAASAAGGGGGGCCNDASSSSSTLDNSLELSLLLVEEDALVALDALVASVLVLEVLSLADRPDRKLMFNSWK